MKILVTGGTGFTGKALVRRLLDDGHQVVALDFQEGLKTEELRDWGAEVVIGTVTDKEVVDRCMQGVEIVHHLAATRTVRSTPPTTTSRPSTRLSRSSRSTSTKVWKRRFCARRPFTDPEIRNASS